MRRFRLPVNPLASPDLPVAILGGWDGTVSTLAFLIGARQAHVHVLLIAGLGGAVGAALSMGSGQYEGDQAPTGRVRRALIMSVASLLGALLPVVGFLTANRTAGFVIALLLALCMAVGVGFVKHHTDKVRTSGMVAVGGTIALWLAVVVAAGLLSLLG